MSNHTTPLFSRYRNVLSGARRAISISTSKHLFEQKLHPHNGNNAHGAMGTSVRCIITALDTEALDISVISVFRIVAYALLVSPFPLSLPASTLLSHCPSSTLFLFTVHERCRRRTFDWKDREIHLPTTIFLHRNGKMCDGGLHCVIDNYAVNEIKCRFDLPSRALEVMPRTWYLRISYTTLFR